jgi:hypothetical protein
MDAERWLEHGAADAHHEAEAVKVGAPL